MLSKNKIKYINSLHTKKYRKINEQFVVEGEKIVKECLDSQFGVDSIYATEKWFSKNILPSKFNPQIHHIAETDALKKITQLSTFSPALALMNMKAFNAFELDTTQNRYLFLESIRDPGNLGTIIRTAEWFGLDQIICSPDCVDVFNQKTLQATMGSFLRVKIQQKSLDSIQTAIPNMTIYATSMSGQKLQDIKFKKPYMLLIGNEGKGLSDEAIKKATELVAIEKVGNTEIDSLNAAISASIFLYETSNTISRLE